ncbi:MAG: hypothetical protein ACQEXV_01105 [Bacillota bacterium]
MVILIGITRQTTVLAFQLGDGFSDMILPTSSALMGSLAVSGIPFQKWVRFFWPQTTRICEEKSPDI